MMTDPKSYGKDPWISSEPPGSLTESEELFSAFLKSSNVGVAILDSDLRYLGINRALAEMNGVSAQSHVGKTVCEVLGEIGEPIQQKLAQVVAMRTGLKYEISGKVTPQGEIGHRVIDAFPISSSQGSVTRIGAIVYDLSGPKQLEQSLQKLDGQLRRERNRLQMLSDVSSLISSNWDIARLFPKISARLRRVLCQEFASFALHDAGTGLLVHQATDFPLGKGLLPALQVSPSETPAGQSMQQRKPMILSREQLQAFDDEVGRTLLAEGLQSLCCVPLLRPKGPLGVVLGSTRPEAFLADDVELISQVAAQLAVAIENHRTALEIEQLKHRLGEERRYLEGEAQVEEQFPEIIRESVALEQVLDQVATVAPSDATILILGETGTGKELVAQAIHRMSRLSHGPFIKVNCAAIPTGLLESELFGHERGAFTGATNRKIGRIELADSGTLFLDEVGEISIELQPKLLRVLQDQEFERLGSTKTMKVKVRVLAATNRNLTASIAKGEFRSDLFYRLNVFPIRLPSLRERREDIPVLIRHFVHKFVRRMDRYIETIPKETMKALMQWDWPGSVRELENLMERSVILSEGSALRVPLAELQAKNPATDDESNRSLDSAGDNTSCECYGIRAESYQDPWGSPETRAETNHIAVQDATLRNHPQRLFRSGTTLALELSF